MSYTTHIGKKSLLKEQTFVCLFNLGSYLAAFILALAEASKGQKTVRLLMSYRTHKPTTHFGMKYFLRDKSNFVYLCE